MLSNNFSQEVAIKHTMTINEQSFDIVQSSPKGWYGELVKIQQTPIKRQDSWATELEIQAGEPSLNWPDIYSMSYKTTRETKLQSFNFKIAHILVPCNKYLTTIRIKDDSRCTFCGDQDSISHFYVKCGRSEEFWGKLSEWCERYLDFSLSTLSVAEKMLGLDPTGRDKNRKPVNWLVLKAKYYIQKRKLFFQGDVSLLPFLAEIKADLATERMVCGLENRPRKFRPWWSLYSALG